MLLVYGLTNLAKMGDDSLDKMDPYQRGSRTMSMYQIGTLQYDTIILLLLMNKILMHIIIENYIIVNTFIIILVWESMMKGGFFSSQTTNKSEQDLTDPLGKYY